MAQWILRTMWQQKASFFVSAFSIACALVLVLFLDAVFLGESNKIVNYIRYTKPDIWVMQKGVGNMHMASSFLSDWKIEDVKSVPGVKRVNSILYVNTMVKVGDADWFSYVVGLESGQTRGGPWEMKQGKSIPGEGEILIPSVFFTLFDLSLGDNVRIADSTFSVVGITEGTFSMANSIVFVSLSDLEDILSTAGTLSYMLVDSEEGQDALALARRIEEDVDGVSALTQEQFIANDFLMAMMMGVELVAFMSIIGTALATTIIAFTAFSLVSRHKHELVVCKAMGFSNVSILVSVIIQTMIVTMVGILFSIAIAYLGIPIIQKAAPQISLMLSTGIVFNASALAVFSGILAALLPTYLIVKVDPASAFKA